MPHAVNYDETDYIKDAWSILQHGVEWIPVANPAGYPPGQSYANNLLLSGGAHIFAPCSGYSCGEPVTHPEVGKYLIAIGEWVFLCCRLGCAADRQARYHRSGGS